MPLFRTRRTEFFEAWKFAAADAALALEDWRSADRADKRTAHAVYVAALEREAHSASMLERRQRPAG
jgi:hypothetical protein